MAGTIRRRLHAVNQLRLTSITLNRFLHIIILFSYYSDVTEKLTILVRDSPVLLGAYNNKLIVS